ncbi:hypothetical protein DFH09DRAFT_1038362 [Mycena vulgaris]|nr:hypothetical protein DFH09DRAFT_1038362 [Mycena vulgaris]
MSTLEESLLLVYSDPGPDTTFERFNGWSTAQHAMEGVQAGIHYKAIDGQKPEWLTLHEANSPAIPPCTNPSEIEREPVAELRTFTRSAYAPISSRTHPATTPADLPAEFVYLVSADVTPAAEDAFDAWYGGEHTALFMRVPGWRRVRRYTLRAHEELGARTRARAPHKYLAIHEWSNAEFADTPEYAALLATPHANEMKKSILGIEFRVFELYKT